VTYAPRWKLSRRCSQCGRELTWQRNLTTAEKDVTDRLRPGPMPCPRCVRLVPVRLEWMLMNKTG
jgi:hypothetical protein